MSASSFDFDVVTSPEEQEAILARLREQARGRSGQGPAPPKDGERDGQSLAIYTAR